MGIAIGVITLLIIVWVFSHVDNWSRDLTTNHARLQTDAADRLLRPIEAGESVDQLAERVRAFAQREARWNVVDEQSDADTIKLHLTRTTSIFRYVDDIHVQISPISGGARLEAESRSRVGKGDLGQNPRNLKQLVQSIDGFPSVP